MYKIERTDYGFRLTFGGALSERELTAWLEESRRRLESVDGPFFVFVDMRTLIPLAPEAQKPMNEGQRLYRAKGMLRSVVILSSPVVASQFRRIGGQTGIGKYERYIDASSVPDWEDVGLNWLLHAVDPDLVRPVSRPFQGSSRPLPPSVAARGNQPARKNL
jgi:hypothetical protein